jgi:hypothetical protein
LPKYESVQIFNNGDTTLTLDFTKTSIEQGSCQIKLPEPFKIPPKQTGNCVFGFSPFTVDRFYAKIVICTIEQTFTIPVTGVGIKINLSQTSKKILQNEKFATLQKPTPFYSEPKYLPIDFAVKKLQAVYERGVEFYDLLSIIYQQEESKRSLFMDPNQMEFQTKKRISFLHENVNVDQTTFTFKNVVETKEPVLVEISLEGEEKEVDVQTSIQRIENNLDQRKFSIVPVCLQEPLVDSEDQVEKVYISPYIERPSSRNSNASMQVHIDETKEFELANLAIPSEFVEQSEELLRQTSATPKLLNENEHLDIPDSRRSDGSRVSVGNDDRPKLEGERPKSKARKRATEDTESKETFDKDDPNISLNLANSSDGLNEILTILKKHYDPFGEVNLGTIERIARQVLFFDIVFANKANRTTVC